MYVNKSFLLDVPPSANMITEAFGIDGGYTKQICDMDIPDEYTILYITGESGSGKSVILNEMFPDYKSELIPEKKPLFLWGGDSQNQQMATLRILTLVGISDATLFINTYDRLSDSQKARARIALELMSNKQTIVVDEFLSTLDRKTAKPVAYCIQKAIRRMGKKLVVATAHDDLTEYLKPTYVITGHSFPSEFTCEKYEDDGKHPILSDVEVTYGDKIEYRNLRLGELHYKGKYTGGTKEYLFARYDDRTVGVLVSTYNRSTGGRRISRLVVHPSYRGIGIGQLIVKRYLSDFDNVDVISAMGIINPVFEKAGMTRLPDSIIKSPSGLKKELASAGVDVSLLVSPNYCNEVCLDNKIREIVAKYASHATDLVCPAGEYLSIERIAEKIKNEPFTSGRVLFGLRDRRLSKCVWKGDIESS